ncbi:MAG TPA: hypothetical protein VHE08_06690 [Solirubrobacterales bacterium]|nr:hypothetical protein [Solirubrobacterales bacterium]
MAGSLPEPISRAPASDSMIVARRATSALMIRSPSCASRPITVRSASRLTKTASPAAPARVVSSAGSSVIRLSSPANWRGP